MSTTIRAKMSDVLKAIAHYESVQKRFGSDDLSEAYSEAIGDVPNYHIRDDNSVIVFQEGGTQFPVTIIPEDTKP